MILDTNALSAFFEGDEELQPILANAAKIRLPVIVLGEYRCGLQRSRYRKVIEPALEALVRTTEVLAVDVETVPPYVQLCDALKRAGTPIPMNDLWIAALALQHNLPVVTRDLHFDRIPKIRRIGW